MKATAWACGMMLVVWAGSACADQTVPTAPFTGPAHAIGSAANGCLSGAEAMPLSGPGWEVLRPARNRFWGHPALIAFLKNKAAATRSLGTLLIADIAQPRGGHMVSGHGSHQTGVDADILYRLADGPLSDDERASPALDEVLADDGTLISDRWAPRQMAVLRAFATDAKVERIFVNPGIKRALCRLPGDHAWLHRLRPWWGHDEHFHVRITCPVGDSTCIAGPPIPAGDGCGSELDWWFTQDARQPKPVSGPKPEAPAACRAVLAP